MGVSELVNVCVCVRVRAYDCMCVHVNAKGQPTLGQLLRSYPSYCILKQFLTETWSSMISLG